MTAEDGRVLSAIVAPREGNAVRLLFDEPKGVEHGHYKVRLAYRVDLVQAHAFARDGTMWRLTWRSPTFSDGYDGARVTFVVPAAVDEPRVADSGDGAGPGILSTLRRAADQDELELVKPHVARHESVDWTVRVAPRAFPVVRDPSLRPAPVLIRSTEPERGPPVLVLLGLSTVAALAYAWLAHRKSAAFDRDCRAFGTHAEGLVGLRHDLRTALAGAAFGAGVLLEAAHVPTLGASSIAAAMLLATLRPPRVRAAARGPGKWLALRPEDAFARRRAADVFDPSSWKGAVALLLVLASLFGLALALRTLSLRAPYLVALDAAAILPLVVTGRRSQLPPDAWSAAPWLGRIFASLSKQKSLRVAAWARVPVGCEEPDEVRVLVLPRGAMPGLVGIEVGLAWRSARTSFASTPGVLVRVHGSSAASARMTTLASFARPVPGRHAEERVFRLGPRLPSVDGTLKLVKRLARELEDRRVAAAPWDCFERRGPQVEREGPVERAAA